MFPRETVLASFAGSSVRCFVSKGWALAEHIVSVHSDKLCWRAGHQPVTCPAYCSQKSAGKLQVACCWSLPWRSFAAKHSLSAGWVLSSGRSGKLCHKFISECTATGTAAAISSLIRCSDKGFLRTSVWDYSTLPCLSRVVDRYVKPNLRRSLLPGCILHVCTCSATSEIVHSGHAELIESLIVEVLKLSLASELTESLMVEVLKLSLVTGEVTKD